MGPPRKNQRHCFFHRLTKLSRKIDFFRGALKNSEKLIFPYELLVNSGKLK